ncbi:MAG: hypothetical protein ACK5JJ_14950 [Cyanobacteriota bacterium]|jgi:hypothetical protein
MRQNNESICFYEPLHPKLNTLAEAVHSSDLGHSVQTSPWAEHQHFRNSSAYTRYADELPQYIIDNMGYHHPFCLTKAVEGYFQSLQSLAIQENKSIIACFNRSAFVAPAAANILSSCNLIYVHTRRPSLQIAMSLANIYARSKDFNLFSREYRDPWGITLLFDQYYTHYSDIYKLTNISSTAYSFVAKACYIIGIVDLCMQKLSPIVFDISQSMDDYRLSTEELFCRLGYKGMPENVDTYIRNTFKQDATRLSLPESTLTSNERILLESINFRDFS